MIGICPRCGRELVRGSTPTGKVCFRCASCGGVAVTLPVLRESLDVRSIAALYAWPDLRIKDRIGLMSVYSGIVGLSLFAFAMLDALVRDFLSCGMGPIAACLALGAILGRRSRKLRCTAF